MRLGRESFKDVFLGKHMLDLLKTHNLALLEHLNRIAILISLVGGKTDSAEGTSTQGDSHFKVSFYYNAIDGRLCL